MKLHSTTRGTGADLAMLHGWGMHSGIWEDFADALARYYRVTTIDLPGHGRSTALPTPYDLAQLANWVRANLPGPAHILGWSLGGMVAQQMVISAPEAVRSLVLIAASPQFVRSDDWPFATPEQTLQQFAHALGEDYRDTLNRFLALEVQSSEAARAELRTLRQRAFAHGEPQFEALRGGLEILRTTNLRKQFAMLDVPTLVMLGQRDGLVPAQVAGDLLAIQPRARTRIIEGAAHAPFLTRPEECVAAIYEFLQ